jgi:phospholipase/carboxylesterase
MAVIFVPMFPELGLPATMAVRFIFPDAPSIPIVISGKPRNSTW